jgi:hypothetical protein
MVESKGSKDWLNGLGVEREKKDLSIGSSPKAIRVIYSQRT